MASRQDKGVTFELSRQKNKKYAAVLPDGKRVNFGDKRYPQYKDQTPLKAYKHLNHGDPKRRDNYYARHGQEAKKHSPKWFAHRYLW